MSAAEGSKGACPSGARQSRVEGSTLIFDHEGTKKLDADRPWILDMQETFLGFLACGKLSSRVFCRVKRRSNECGSKLNAFFVRPAVRQMLLKLNLLK